MTINLHDSLDTVASKLQRYYGYDLLNTRDTFEAMVSYHGWTTAINKANQMLATLPQYPTRSAITGKEAQS